MKVMPGVGIEKRLGVGTIGEGWGRDERRGLE